jgi:hypothetical protein
MKTHDFTTTLVVDQSPKEVFNAVINPQSWWSGEIEGGSTKLNDEFNYRYQDIHYSIQRVVEFVPDQKVVWLVTESNLNYTEDPNEWAGTKITFEITGKDGKTELLFSHTGLGECFDYCSGAWTHLVQQSLASLIRSGEGLQLALA